MLAELIYALIVLVLLLPALKYRTHPGGGRLIDVCLWLAIFVGLVWLYKYFHPQSLPALPDSFFNKDGTPV
jgi:hypothetical protein